MRRRRSLTEPPSELRWFPGRRLTPRRTLWRIHLNDRCPWWFCSDLECRFDLQAPQGTCYVAEDPLGSFVEVFTDVALVAEEDVERRRLSALHVPRTLRLADCTHEASRGFGCTGEIHTTIDYDLTQRWARAFAAASFDGIRYFVRHDPAQRRVGIALFGDAGEAGGWPEPTTEEIGEDLLMDVAGLFGIRVLPRP
ncbi:MAG: RES family NAD+ phosphorylase [Actinomycetota bacterium]